MMKASMVNVAHYPHPRNSKKSRTYYWSLREVQRELKPFAENLYVLSKPTGTNYVKVSTNGNVSVNWFIPRTKRDKATGGFFEISIGNREGVLTILQKGKPMMYDLHPATTKRWLELLLNHPRIGPELRRRMQR